MKMYVKVFSYVVFVAFLAWVATLPARAFYDFMAPGVPPQAMCKEVNVDQRIRLVLKPQKLSLNVGETSDVDIVLQNIGSAEARISYLDLVVTYPPDLVKVNSIKVDSNRVCGVVVDQSYIKNEEGVFRLLLDQTTQEGCQPIAVPKGEDFVLGQVNFIALNEGIADFKVNIQQGKYQASVAFSYDLGQQNVIVEVHNASVNIGASGVDTPTEGPTPSEGPTTPVPTQPPSTGVMETGMLALSILLLMVALVYYYKNTADFDDKILID